MKTICLIGGMSSESTVPSPVDQRDDQGAAGRAAFGEGDPYSVDFHKIERLQHSGDWEAAVKMFDEDAHSLEAAGADFLVLCTKTMHNVALAIEAAVRIPLFHIADPTAGEIKRTV